MSILRRAVVLQDADTLALVRSVPFFSRLSDTTLTRLLARCPMQSVPAHRTVYRQDDAGDALYVILAGEIQLIQPFDGISVPVSTLRRGDYFGELSLLEDTPRTATARTIQDSFLLEVRKQDFLELLHEQPAIFNDAMRVLSTRLREQNATSTTALVREKQALENENQRLKANYEATLEALSAALDLRDQATQGHSQRVTAYTLLIADELSVGPESREALRLGALLHDIGKIGVSDNILRKTATLTPGEWVEMNKHPEWGAAIVERIEFLREARDIVLSHHEKFDGTGYPRGLAGTTIPLGARIFAIADVFDAVTTFRPYRMPMSPHDAASLIRRDVGRHFDPDVVDAFERALPQMIDVMRASFTGNLNRITQSKPPP